jgi:hypothetical protein
MSMEEHGEYGEHGKYGEYREWAEEYGRHSPWHIAPSFAQLTSQANSYFRNVHFT